MKKNKIIRRIGMLLAIVAVLLISTLFPKSEVQSTVDKESYSWYSFANTYEGIVPCNYMRFSSRATVEKLKTIYDNLEFYNEFKESDPSVYDFYAEKYTRLLKSEVEFYNTQYSTHHNLAFWGYDVEFLKSAAQSIYCLVFDMDEDGKPELCLSGTYGAFVFKYIPEMDQYVTWWEADTANYQMMGSRKVNTFYLDGLYEFDQLSKTGEVECKVFLVS